MCNCSVLYVDGKCTICTMNVGLILSLYSKLKKNHSCTVSPIFLLFNYTECTLNTINMMLL